MRGANRIFKVGADTDIDRVWDANELGSSIIPDATIMPKDQKEYSENGDPKTCPVCNAKHTINGER